jgi:putative hemolysin
VGERGLRQVVGLVVAGIALAACAVGSATGSPTAVTASGTTDQAVAAAYCTEQGGQLVDRVAMSNTNGDSSARLELAGRMRLCEFESPVEGDDAPTRISVDLTTLSSEEPTLAAIAYLSKVPTPEPPTVGQNPAEYACRVSLQGTASFGNTNLSGGWVDASQPVFEVMDLCVFADGSAIDEFGIWYYANDIVRGADLAPLFRYQPGDEGLPAIYERSRP